jgi:hypothetical protein
MSNHRPETGTASEIADFVFCAESWRLAQLCEFSRKARIATQHACSTDRAQCMFFRS